MLVTFDKNSKTFNLSNNNISYVFFVNKEGMLIKQYFGRKINDIYTYNYDLLNNIHDDFYCYYNTKENKEYSYGEKPYISGEGSLFEVPTYLSFDKREPLVIINHKDNSSITDFRYFDYKIFKGKTIFENMPYIRANDCECETLEIILKDIKDDIYLHMFYTIFKNKDVIVRHNKIVNKSGYNIKIERANSLNLDLLSMNYKLISIHGIYATDREIEEQDIFHNNIEIKTIDGAKTFYHNPMAMIKEKKANDEYGEAIGFGLVYSGNFKFSFNGTKLDQLRCSIGINDENFEYILNNDEVFETPEAIIIYSYKGTDFVTNTFHNLIRENLLRLVPVSNEKIILLNSWEATHFNFNTEKVMNFISSAKNMGVNLFVLDDGWFGKRDNDLCSLGDWSVNIEKINLKKVIEYAHSIGVKFGLWFEPEMISYDSNLYKNHPEFALFDKTINPTLWRHQLVLDMTSKEVRDYIFNELTDVLDNYDIDYVKWDFNRSLCDIYSESLKKENQKEIYHRFTLGTYDLLNRFIKRYPNILLETCSAGGGRFDMGMLFYSPQIWASDETDGIQRTYIQYSTNMFYPLRTIGAHVSARKYLSIKEKASIAMFGTFGYEMDPTKLNEEDLKEVAISNERYLNNIDLIKNGDYYSLLNPYEGRFVSWMCISKDKKNAVIFLFNYRHINWTSRFLKIKGLVPNKKYLNSLDNTICYGDYLMNVGVNYSIGMQAFTPILFNLVMLDD